MDCPKITISTCTILNQNHFIGTWDLMNGKDDGKFFF